MSILSLSNRDAEGSDFISDTDFRVRLKVPLQQVVGFSLLEAVVPFTWFPIRGFHFPCGIDGGLFHDLEIPDGRYSPDELCEELLKTLKTHLSIKYNRALDRFEVKNIHASQNVTIDLSAFSDETLAVLGRKDSANVTLTPGDEWSYNDLVAPRLLSLIHI